MKKILSILSVLALATACIYPYQPDLEDAPDGVLVVDGNLLIGEKSTVWIGYMQSLWPKETTPIDGGGGYYYASSLTPSTTHVWAEDDGGGKYEGSLDYVNPFSSSYYYYYVNVPYTIPLENAPADRNYRLCVQMDNLLYTSEWAKPLAPPVLKDISFKATKPEEGALVNVYVSLDGGEEATGYTLLTFDETWRFHADYYPNYDYNPSTNTVFDRLDSWTRYWCWKNVNNGQQTPVDFTGMSTSSLKEFPLHSFSRYDNRNHKRYSIRVTARTIDKTTYRYLSHLEESTESGDNLFTPNPGEIAGNLRCETDPDRMVLGYVTVARTTSMRAYLGSEYLLTMKNSGYLVYPLASPQPGIPGWREYYERGYLPLEEYTGSDSERGPYGWGEARCYDCIAAGGTQERPDFWED